MMVRPYWLVKINVPFLSEVSPDYYYGYIQALSDAAGFTKEQTLKLFDFGVRRIAIYRSFYQVDLKE